MVEYYDYKELESVKATSPNVLYYKFVEMFNENRPFYAQLLDSAIEASEETKFSIAQAVNIWASVMSRATQPVFYISVPTIVGVAKILHFSLHSFLFNNEYRPVILPKSLGLTAKTLGKMQDFEIKTEIIPYLQRLQKEDVAANGVFEESLCDLIRRRILEYAEYKNLYPVFSYDSNAPIPKFRLIVKRMILMPQKEPALPTLAYIGYVGDQPFDYYVFRDYTKQVPISYIDNGESVLVKKDNILLALSFLLEMRPEVQAKAIAHICYNYKY